MGPDWGRMVLRKPTGALLHRRHQGRRFERGARIAGRELGDGLSNQDSRGPFHLAQRQVRSGFADAGGYGSALAAPNSPPTSAWGPSPTEGGRRQQQEAVRPTCLYCLLPLPTADCWKRAGRSPNCF